MIHAQRPLAYMAALDLAGRRCVVLGGGEMATLRVAGLLDAGALVTVVAPALQPTLGQLAAAGSIEWTARAYQPGDLRGAFLALNTIDNAATERSVRVEASAEGVLLNTHDRPASCDFASPALVRRGRLQVAVSTSGDSPYVAAAMRERLDKLIGEEWGALLTLVAGVRRRLRRAKVPATEQQRVYRRLLRPQVRASLRREGGGAAGPLLGSDGWDTAAPAGVVHLVGAGPGDPGLLTLAARELLLDADVVFHDALVSPGILDLCGERTRLVDVGKRGGGLRTSQDGITAQLIEAAHAGLEVVRLKGGDPFVFGRGGEELHALRSAGIATNVVPGVTSALAAPAAADIPVTFRGVSSSVAIVTGRDSDGQLPRDLEAIAAAVDTLVVLMPLAVLPALAERLTPLLGPQWPAAVIASATTEGQTTVRAPLCDITAAVAAARIVAPATLVLGRVVDCVRQENLAAAPDHDAIGHHLVGEPR
jgi:uroporphyrin-III C-methyltransferase / precorrin-2 dehydrogenase / sirohydrochlorin ferrochelatase